MSSKGRSTRKPRADWHAAAQVDGAAKAPKLLSRLGVDDDTKPHWKLALVDLGGPWGWAKASPEHVGAILPFLREMEKLTWTEIYQQMAGGKGRRGEKHKYIPIGSLVPSAQRRLTNRGVDEYDGQWFRFRLAGKQRLWGVVQEPVFYPVWWDPEHEVCPNKDR